MSIPTDKSFSKWLLEEMKKQGISQSELARRAGVSRQAISDYVLGKTPNPDPNSLINIARALKETPETIYRVTNLLPMIEEDEADLEDFREILKNLTPEERDELKAIGWLKVDMKKRPPPQKGVNPAKK
jgi:transcriptional regulator with XRE-family HTH domain